MQKAEIYEKLKTENGIDGQLMVAVEELSELTKEITKLSRGKGSTMRLTEEIADVQICIEQLQQFFCVSNQSIKVFKDFKLKRLEEFYIDQPLETNVVTTPLAQTELDFGQTEAETLGCTFDE